MEIQRWFFYLARCSDQHLYAGITNNLEKRELLHNLGKGAQFTKIRRPVRIVYSEKYEDKSLARKREIQIKKWSRYKKENLIRQMPQF